MCVYTVDFSGMITQYCMCCVNGQWRDFKTCVYSHILDTAVTEREFVEQLHELNHKINFVKEQSFRDARACHDVRDILDKLRWKVGD